MSNSQRRKLQAASWLAVVRAYQECTRRYGQLLRGFDLTIPQFDVMNAIRQLADEATPRAIADELLVTRGNITGVLHRLQERSLITTRHNEQDGRSIVCSLTSDGQVLMDKARSAAAVFIETQLGPFDDATLRQTEDQMNRMRSHLQTIDPDAIAEQALRRARTSTTTASAK